MAGNYGATTYLSQIDTERKEGLQESSQSHSIGHIVISAASSCLALPRIASPSALALVA